MLSYAESIIVFLILTVTQLISGGSLALHNAESKILFRVIELTAESDNDLMRGASNAEILKRINITPVDFRATR